MRTEFWPKEVQALCRDSEVTELAIGRSAAQVYKINTGSDVLYLKTLVNNDVESFQVDVDRLEWLKGKLPVPGVLSFEVVGNHEFLLLSEVSGINGVEQMELSSAEDLTCQLAKGLRQVHDVDISSCPLDERTSSKLQRAKTRVLANVVDETDFDDERMGMTAKDIYELLSQQQPDNEELVLNHGDYCLPNVMFTNNRVTGFIDLDRAGVADRYNDLAIASRSIVSNLGEGFGEVFFDAYGVTDLDLEKINYFRMMDEMF
jgi:aminoglycoside phosphotransferase